MQYYERVGKDLTVNKWLVFLIHFEEPKIQKSVLILIGRVCGILITLFYWNTHIINNTDTTYNNNITNNTDITYNTNTTSNKITITHPYANYNFSKFP